MKTTYTVDLQNNSTQSGSFCIFQEPPDVNVANVVTLAWLAKPVHPTTRVQFQWQLDYNFAWSTCTDLSPGTRVLASQIWDANLSTENQIHFDLKNKAYTFSQQSQGAYEGNLYIEQGKSVQSGQASVGIGMSGQGTFMVPSQPNMQILMTPIPTYWLTFGSFEEGEVLDIGEVTRTAHKVDFKGTESLRFLFTDDNKWTAV